jgi:hypothetical protein
VLLVLQGLGVKRQRINEVMRSELPALREPAKSRSLFVEEPAP